MTTSTVPINPVIQVINQLPVIQQSVIVQALTGKSVIEISRTLNLPFQEIKSHIYTALDKIYLAELTLQDSQGFTPQTPYYYYQTNPKDTSWLQDLPISSQLLLNFDSIKTVLTHLQVEQPPSGTSSETDSGGQGSSPSGGGGGSFDPGNNVEPPSGTSSETDNDGGTANPPTDPTDPPAPDTGETDGEVIGPPNIDPINTIFLNGIEFEVYYKPALFLTEIEYSEELIGQILNYPPTAPIAKFYPLKDNISDFMVTLEPSVGFIRDEPKYIYNYDVQRFKDVLEQQNSEDGKVAFKYQGDVALYEIFRLENEPKSYLDFSIDESRKISYIKNRENVMFRETVEPNKTYYYTFRTKDTKQSVSNPSPVFAVKLYVNDGIENLDVSEFVFKEQRAEKSQTFKKFLQIDANLLQKTFSVLQNKLGLLSESVYDRKFLLKIKSKHTNKTVDLVIRFNKLNGV